MSLAKKLYRQQKTKFNKIIFVINYVKLCWNRANGHLRIGMSVFRMVSTFLILFKLFEIKRYWLVAVLSFCGIICMFGIGYLDLKYHIMDKEVYLTNQFNPDIQTIKKYALKNEKSDNK